MRDGLMGRGIARAGTAVLMVGLLMTVGGCRTKKLESELGLSETNAQQRQADVAADSAKKVGRAGAEIVSACAKEPYANASKGLIVSETGLHEDVFELRDRVSYKAVAFGLSEAQRVEALLQEEIGASSHSSYPAEQTECIQQFADHIKELTDPLVDADEEQKQLDVSAFDSASKEAQQEIEQEEKAIQPSTTGHM